MTLFSVDVSDDYLCQGFNKDFNKINKHNFLIRRFNFRKLVNKRLITLDDDLRKLNNLFAESNRTNYLYTQKEKKQVYDKVHDMLNKSFFNEEEKANISTIRDLSYKQNVVKNEMDALQNKMKSLENEIKLLADDI